MPHIIVSDSWLRAEPTHTHTGQEALSHLQHLFLAPLFHSQGLVFISFLQSYWPHVYIAFIVSSLSCLLTPSASSSLLPSGFSQCCSSPPPPHAPGNVKSLVKTWFSPFPSIPSSSAHFQRKCVSSALSLAFIPQHLFILHSNPSQNVQSLLFHPHILLAPNYLVNA